MVRVFFADICSTVYRVNNFSKDVSDGENYTILLNQLKPDVCSRAPLQERDLLTRAEMILDNAEKIECRKYLTPSALVAGNPKLNLAFVAHLFNTHPGLDPLTEEEAPEIEPFDAEGEREARGKIPLSESVIVVTLYVPCELNAIPVNQSSLFGSTVWMSTLVFTTCLRILRTVSFCYKLTTRSSLEVSTGVKSAESNHFLDSR